MDFETLRIEKDIDKYLEVKMDYKGSVDWVSDIKTNTFLNECYEILYEEATVDLIDFIELSTTSLQDAIKESKKRINYFEGRNKDLDPWMITQHQRANLERKKKKKFLKKWIEGKKSEKTQKETAPVLDLSNKSISSKIIYLSELGVLDVLIKTEPFNTSINLLASALSGITGDKAETIQSYINPIFSKGANQKNNPLNRVKSVEKVKQSLIQLGFKPHN